ncbi:P-loop containing nucleoside triphosphate hydrolase protein [Sordaria brevicollis]|uniref:P-loop containing nucleoside triphosphate hydrolase protein n=1 Tax=Sordaria brevicollis TaxID=83679 RepID=A0AAE0U8Y5_SORBR|nr:P-loop containing nucleoside triphosphate hydrolase protein [Sordaria brevicollis]
MSSLSSTLNAHELAGEQGQLLDLLEKLQYAQLENVKLPQVVVVGDQSAGKSSVLEAITGIPFPREAGACTRFATEIRLRRFAESSIVVSIIPDRNRPSSEQKQLLEFGQMVNKDSPFDLTVMGAAELIAPKGRAGRFAARDILVVEKKGPDMPLLTLVDLPGLVRNPNKDQSVEDIRIIDALSDQYMQSPRTIILAVVGGNSDYVQAPVLTKARHFDPNGTRTIGVLTKPDLTDSIGLEDKFIELVKNNDRRNNFRLGWYVLLNPGPRSEGQPWPSEEQRRLAEQDFFSKGKWSSLPKSMCGASALKQKLSIQLQQHIGKHVHALRRQIQKALDDCDEELMSLGTAKNTPEEMRLQLIELFYSSNELVVPAAHGYYKNPPNKHFFRVTADPRGTPAQNLRARAAEENDRFSARIRSDGRKFKLSASDGSSSADTSSASSLSRSEYARLEVSRLLHQIRGSEFPMDSTPRAVYMLFQSHSEPWPRLAQEHKDNVGAVCNDFLHEVIKYIWPQRMREPLRRHFLDSHMKALMNEADQELKHLMQDLNLEVQPYDPEYQERLVAWKQQAAETGTTYTEAEEILEKMLIFYELSAKTFIRNVITQVVERHLLQGMYSIFNPAEVMAMTSEMVESIAAENQETRDRRRSLTEQRKAIQEAKDVCTSLAMRKELRDERTDDYGLGVHDGTTDEDEPQWPWPKPSRYSGTSPRRRPVPTGISKTSERILDDALSEAAVRRAGKLPMSAPDRDTVSPLGSPMSGPSATVSPPESLVSVPPAAGSRQPNLRPSIDEHRNIILAPSVAGPPQLPMAVPPVPPRQLQIAERLQGQRDGPHGSPGTPGATQETDQDAGDIATPSTSSVASPPTRSEVPAKKPTSTLRKLFS